MANDGSGIECSGQHCQKERCLLFLRDLGFNNFHDSDESKAQDNCKLRQNISSKPSKHGITMYSLAEARTFYSNNIKVYCERQPESLEKCKTNPFLL